MLWVRTYYKWWLALAVALLLCACEGQGPALFGGPPTGSNLGRIFEEGTDTFPTRFSQRTDILAVVDNSGSMSQERTAVRNAMVEFHRHLNEARVNDYRFAVVTTDAYTHEGKLVKVGATDIVNGSSAAAVSQAQALMDGVVNTAKSHWEQGLKSAERALSVNATRFLRADTDLALIFLTDEEDYSCLDAKGSPAGRACPGMETSTAPESFPAPKPWSPVELGFYKAYLEGLNRSVLVFPIVGTADRRCEEVSRGARYQSLQELIGTGFTSPICNDRLSENFARIGREISDRGDCYKLTHTSASEEKDLEVKLDGESVSASAAAGFTLDRPSNSVCFRGSLIPGAGATLTVRYGWYR